MRFSASIVIGIFSSLRCRAIDWTPIGFVIQPNVNAGQGNKNFCLTAISDKANSKLVLRECDHSNIDKKAIWTKWQSSNTIYAHFNTWTKSKPCILSPKKGGPLRLSLCKNKKKAAIIDWDKNGSIHTIKSNLFTAKAEVGRSVVTASPPSTQRGDIQNWKWIPIHQKGELYATLDSVKLCGHTPFSYEKKKHPGFARLHNVAYVRYYAQDDDDRVWPEPEGQCTDEQKTRLDFAVRYMRAASKSDGFEYCLRNAVTSGVNLGTSHEMLTPRVGPYVRCHPIKGNYQPGDPELQNLNIGYDVVMNVIRANSGIKSLSAGRQIYHKCTGEDYKISGYTAVSPASDSERSYRWDWTRDIGLYAVHLIEWTNKFYTVRSDWTAGESIDPLFGDLGSDSYPVDELSGIILHEMLHNVKFAHGPKNDPVACNYDVWNCLHGPSPEQTCRMNSLNEIAEACMSEIVQFSTDNCDPLACDYGDEVNLFEIVQVHDCDYDDDQVTPGCGKLGFLGGECRCTRFW